MPRTATRATTWSLAGWWQLLRRWWVLEIVVVATLLAIIRLPFYGQIPSGLNRDEASLGYTAFSLGTSGIDEYGKHWPLSITSFGDQKLPGYVYILIPFVKVLGLQIWVVRLPSLLAGLAIIGWAGLLAQQLTQSWQWSEHHRRWFSRLAMVAVAISPWGNHFSRVAYEAHLALALFAGGLVAYQFAVQQTNPSTRTVRQQRVALVVAVLGWVGAMLTYHSYQMLVPIMTVGLLLIDWRRWFKLDRLAVSLAGSLLALGTVLALSVSWQANQAKSIGISPFHRPDLQVASSLFRHATPWPDVVNRLFFNSATEAGWRLAKNVISLASFDFWFIQGTPQSDHNPGGIANHHLFLAPFVLLGLATLWDQRRHASTRRWGWWLLATLIPPSLTIQPQHTTRFSPSYLIIEMLAAVGLIVTFTWLHKHWQRRLWAGALLAMALWSITRLMVNYWWLAPTTYPGHLTPHILAKAITPYAATGRQIIVQKPQTSPYIWYLFETRYSATLLQTSIERYPTDAEAFQHVRRIGTVQFKNIDWGELMEEAKTEPLILLFTPQEIPPEWRLDARMQYRGQIPAEGEALYEVWEVDGNRVPVL